MINTFGNLFNIEIYGGSHTPTLGVKIFGLPKDFVITSDDLIDDIKRRQPGAIGTTPRKEADIPEITQIERYVSTSIGKRCEYGYEISFKNSNINNNVYNQFVDTPRPSHADYTQYNKYGKEYDMTGGGMASGRMTLPIVVAGSVAKKLFRYFGEKTTFESFVYSIGGYRVFDEKIIQQIIEPVVNAGDSIGAEIECIIHNVPKFIGEPFFDSIESIISHLSFSIPGVKGIEFGDGFSGSWSLGSERNDTYIDADGHTNSNNEGGINGGISNGNDINFKLAVKPTASIFKPQQTFNFKTGQIETLQIKGRHDACIGLRVPVIAESIAAIALIDLYMIQNKNKFEEQDARE